MTTHSRTDAPTIDCRIIAKQAQLRSIGRKTERRKDDNQIGDIGDHRAQPVSPCGAEADQFAESFASVGEDPAARSGRIRVNSSMAKARNRIPTPVMAQPMSRAEGATAAIFAAN